MNTSETMKHVWGTTIAIVTYGHVWIAKEVAFDGEFYHFTNARIITSWGTQRGLNQLCEGPTKETVLSDVAAHTIVMPDALIALIPAQDAKWEKHL